MPDVTAGSDEGVLAAWLVEETARFDAAQTIAYVETDDELFSVEAGRPGVLLKTLIAPGTRVAPGAPIGILAEPWEQVPDPDAILAELGLLRREPVVAAPVSEQAVGGHRAELMPLAVAPELASMSDELESPARSLQPPTEPGTASDRVAVSAGPPVDDAVASVTRHVDVIASTTELRSTRRSPVDDAPAPVDGVVQHHYLRARVRVDRLVGLRAQLDRDPREVSLIELIVRAVTAAHRQVPQLVVAHLDDERGASPSIPISDPGRFGVEEAAAVVPAGQSAALAVGAVRDEPVVDGGAVVPGKVLTLTLSVRPGRVDDAQACRWLAVLVALLERPEWLLE
jgi:pyruvate dehydrogenase E2 component (dihydrolipoamide acetyltransferase)